MTMQPALRPENRQRSSEAGRLWADTVPLCFRSEAFPEDLAHADDPAPPPAAAAWHGVAATPLLGLAMAAVWGAMGGASGR